MNPQDQRKITSNLLRIKKAIQKDVATIADTLVDEHVFTATIRSEIIGARPSHLQVGILINKLLRSGTDAYRTFIKVLEEKGLTSLVAKLENSEREATEPNLHVKDRERTFVLPSPQIPSRIHEDADLPCYCTKTSTHDNTSSKEVVHLEKMMTFVLTNFEKTDRNYGKDSFDQRFNERSRHIVGSINSPRYNQFSTIKEHTVH